MGPVRRSIQRLIAGAALFGLALADVRPAAAEPSPLPPPLPGAPRAASEPASPTGAVGAIGGAAPPASAVDLRPLERGIDEVEELVADALFHTAVRVGEATREQADALPATPQVRVRRAKLDVLLATAEVALGLEERACTSMRRAVAANPGLWLDERTTSPKVVSVLHDPACRAPVAKRAP